MNCQGCKQPMREQGRLFNPYHADCWKMKLRDDWRNYPSRRKVIEETIERIKYGR